MLHGVRVCTAVSSSPRASECHGVFILTLPFPPLPSPPSPPCVSLRLRRAVVKVMQLDIFDFGGVVPLEVEPMAVTCANGANEGEALIVAASETPTSPSTCSVVQCSPSLLSVLAESGRMRICRRTSLGDFFGRLRGRRRRTHVPPETVRHPREGPLSPFFGPTTTFFYPGRLQ